MELAESYYRIKPNAAFIAILFVLLDRFVATLRCSSRKSEVVDGRSQVSELAEGEPLL